MAPVAALIGCASLAFPQNQASNSLRAGDLAPDMRGVPRRHHPLHLAAPDPAPRRVMPRQRHWRREAGDAGSASSEGGGRG